MKKQNKEKVVSIRFCKKEYKAIERNAKEQECTVSEYIRTQCFKNTKGSKKAESLKAIVVCQEIINCAQKLGIDEMEIMKWEELLWNSL